MKKYIYLVISLTLVLVLALIFFFYKDKISFLNNNSLYSELAIKNSKAYNINLNKEDYSPTLEKVIENNLFNEKYFKTYFDINYNNHELFLNTLNLFLDKSYSTKEIEYIYKLSDNNINKLKKIDYINLEKYYLIKNFNVDNYNRYESYEKDNIQDIVTHVNIGLDLGFYKDIKDTTNLNTLEIIASKNQKLPSDYVPDNLVNVLGVQMVEEAAEMLKEFIAYAKREGYNFKPSSAYRNYSWQNSLYSKYKKQSGEKAADTYSARPGHSEHQTGLAVDLGNTSWWNNNRSGIRINKEEYQWILENSYKYGFIVRYQKDKIKITGYVEEPWHLRYLGVDLATKVVESQLSFDEYYDLHLKEY